MKPETTEMNEPTPAVKNREQDLMPTLFGKGYDIYQVQRGPFAFSLLANVAVVAIALAAGSWVAAHPDMIKKPLADSMNINLVPMRPSDKQGGGGGGGPDKTPATKGELPKQSLKNPLMPVTIPKIEHPEWAMNQTIQAPQLNLPTGNNIGDPLSKLGGIGSLGNGGGGGIGPGHGTGYGPGTGGGYGGGAFPIGNGTSSPKQIYAPEPDYSEEGRKAKQQGEVILEIVVGVDGRAHDIRVVRSLGFGLDEEAVKTVRDQWKFEPGMRQGQKVPVIVDVQVDFRLY